MKISTTHLHSLAIIAFAATATQTLAEPTLRAYARIDLDAIDYDWADLYAPPLPLGPGLNIDLSHGGGTAGVRAGFGPLSIRGHGFFNKPANEMGTHAAQSGIGALWNDELRIDAPGKMGTAGFLVTKVRIKGKMLNGDYNIGTAEAPITVEWAGLEVYDGDMKRLTTYSAESASGYDFSLGQAVPVPPTVLGITALGSNAYELKFPGKSNRIYQLQGSTDLGSWFDIGSPFVGNDSEMTLTDTRSEPAFFWRLRLQEL